MPIERKVDSEGQTGITKKPCCNALIVALQENWRHVRYVETARSRHFNLLWIALAAAFAFVLKENKLFDGLVKYWALFAFLGVLSIATLFIVIKLNLEQGNHFQAIEWTSEELGLNKPTQVQGIPHSHYTGYMALPLRLGFRVRHTFKFIMYLGILLTWTASICGLLRSLPNSGMDDLKAISYGILGGIIIVAICYFFETRIEQTAKRLITSSAPLPASRSSGVSPHESPVRPTGRS